MKHQVRVSGSDRLVGHIKGIVSRLLQRPCPFCNGGVSINRLAKTALGKGSKLPWIECTSCDAKLCLSRRHLYKKFWFVLIPVFVLSAGLGVEFFAQFEFTNIYREHRGTYEANGLGFILTMLLFVFPLTTAAQRVFKIEVIE